MSRERRTAGFTLIELIVVIGVMGVVAGMGSLWFARMTEVWRVSRVRAELDVEAAQIFDLMARDFAAVASPRLSGVYIRGMSETAQEGDEAREAGRPHDTVIIPVLAPAVGEQQQRAVLVMYRVEGSGSAGALVRTVGELSDDLPAGGQMEVASAVAGLRIEYANGKARDDWSGTWAADSLPMAVRVSITLADPNRINEQVSRKAVFPVHVN